uniref:TSA: Wollemia nobilis Ref_Wollemi_Transcript_2398_1635 transcribed RNA sequence n=1 Tax=Wollemia nobilis TaxID=56998 RepID=A0A0C9RYS6_9CONI
MENGISDLEIHLDSQTPDIQKPLLCNIISPTSRSEEAEIDPELGRLERLLLFLGLDQSTSPRAAFGCFLFLWLGVAVPAVTLWATACRNCGKYEVMKFEVIVQISGTGLAAVSMFCMAHNLRKYGLRKFLFVEFHHPHVRFRYDVKSQIRASFRLLKWIILPCFLVKAMREALRIVYVHEQYSWWENAVTLIAILISWLYLTTVFMSACVLFNLVCKLQIVRVEDYARLLEGASDVSVFLKEHMYLRYQLYKISHRFRIYILVAFVVVTGSQFMTLFEATFYSGKINFINAGDFLVSSAVQLVGVALCLRAAAKTTHKSQRIASIASQWHALATCNSSDVSESKDEANENGPVQDADPIYSLMVGDYESDLDSSEDLALDPESHFASNVASYQKRQALVMYFQFNQAGITIFGLVVDRALFSTLFFVEQGLILWVLGKTIVANSSK